MVLTMSIIPQINAVVKYGVMIHHQWPGLCDERILKFDGRADSWYTLTATVLHKTWERLCPGGYAASQDVDTH